MKNTKSRKKILLSSIAMLLVALVALGSATYAWFTVNKTVTAGTMQITAAAPSGLQITADGTTWGTTVSYAANDVETLYPVSLAKDASTGYYPRAVASEGVWTNAPSASLWSSIAVPFTAADTVAAAGDANEGKFVTCNNYYRVYKVGVRSEDGSNIGSVNATISVTGTGSNYTKVQLFNAAKTSAVLNYTDEDYTPVTAITAATDTPTIANSAVSNNATGQVIADLSTGGTSGTYFYVVVYFEGNDGDCVNNNAGKPGNVTLTFTLA